MSYTKGQIHEFSGLSLRLVQFYTEEGLISPEESAEKGRGYVRKYSRQSLIDFMVIKELADFGMTKPKIKAVLNYINRNQYAKSYIEEGLYKEGQEFFLYLYPGKKNKLGINYKMIGAAENKTVLLTMENMENYTSCITINFGQIVKRADKE